MIIFTILLSTIDSKPNNLLFVGNRIYKMMKTILCDMVKRDEEHRAKWPWGAVRRVDDDKVLLVISRKVIEVEQAINLCVHRNGYS